MPLTRRAFVAACMVAPAAKTRADDFLRPPPSSTDPRYAGYSLQGSYAPTESPIAMTLPGSGTRVLVFHPLGAPSGRLVVFSHGLLSEPQVYRALLSHLASHGFIVACPIHDDSLMERGLRLRSAAVNGGAAWNLGGISGDTDAWRARAHACASVLDGAAAVSNAVNMVALSERPIIVGHGLGAFTAMLLMGASAKARDGQSLALPDARFYGGAMLSPYGEGAFGLDGTSWAGMTRPLLAVTGKGDFDASGQDGDRRADVFSKTPPGYKHLAMLRDASPSMFSGQRATTEPKELMRFDDVKAVTTAFLKAYGYHDQQAFSDIVGDWFLQASQRRLDFSYR